jgi:ATP-dependent helicase/nuclease subunit A
MSREIPPLTLERQRIASDPARSVWVSANAGSGKTHVLSQRVVRLLLQGVDPARILCLTFTRAAAANMSQRVFAILAQWTQADDAALTAAIVATGAPRPGAVDLVAARRLFARAVETPGGLKIQTIHAFCERLLHLFPFEANVAAGFEVAEEAERQQWLASARRDALDAAARDEGALGAALRRVAGETSPDEFDKLLRDAMKHRDALPLDARGEARLRDALGVDRGETTAAVEREMLENGLLARRWREVGAALARGKPTDVKRAGKLYAIREAHAARGDNAQAQDRAALLDDYLSIFFKGGKGEGDPPASLATKDIPQPIKDALGEEQARLLALRDRRRAVAACERTLALARLVEAVLARYGAIKARRGALDFDDLIARAQALLERVDAAWVLYKLDRGVDHILVDEAQDTSAAQWRILEALTGEFAVGRGQRAGRRSFFAVGDDKQSIFSFQGAAPRLFHAMRRRFETRVTAAGQPFAAVQLNLSFRSGAIVLKAVDEVFASPDRHRGLSPGDVRAPTHEAWKKDLPGLVEIWPAIGAGDRADDPEWRLPVDALRADDPAVKLADRVARKIADLTAPDSDARVADGKGEAMRRVRPGDILILVRRRGPLFEAVIRALKERHVAVAGADRLALTQHIAVMDLVAAGRVALLPQDDLTLACVLKSPLIGLDDDDLIALAPGRAGSLFDALAASETPRHRDAFATIELWRGRAAALTPFEFYMRLIEAGGGRRAMAARLGPEAVDAIDEFVALALEHEAGEAPSLALFLDALRAAEIEIRRDMEAAGDAVRVMTVHAAKGLEAKIVFLPDCCATPSAQHAPKLHRLGDDDDAVLAWSSRKDDDSAAIAQGRADWARSEEDEYHRLLYVALTRAEERLYVAGHFGKRQPSPLSWHNAIRTGLAADLSEAPAFWDASETIWRRVDPGRPPPEAPDQGRPDPSSTPEPPWLRSAAPSETPAAPPLRPSSALDAADTPEFDDEAAVPVAPAPAFARGRLIHALLQHLPDVAPARRDEAARRFLAARGGAFAEADRQIMVAQALAVLNDDRLAALFGPASRAEAAIAGKARLADGREVEISGRIDRLAEADDCVLLADFKTGAPRDAGATPARMLTQFALYRAALAPLWPGRRIRALVVWTAGPAVVELNETDLDAALARLASP